MPLIGVALGAPLGHAIGSVADYIAAGLIAALGVYMVLIDNNEQVSCSRSPRADCSVRSRSVSASASTP